MPQHYLEFAFLVALLVGAHSASAQIADWPVTEGAPGGGRYSPLADIHRGNVHELQMVWTYRHGDVKKGRFPFYANRGSAFESTPLVVGGRLILTTPFNRVIALDPETGRELWTYDPEIDRSGLFANMASALRGPFSLTVHFSSGTLRP